MNQETARNSKRYYAQNREKVIARTTKYQVIHPEIKKKCDSQYYFAHPERVKDRSKKYRTANLERIRERDRLFHAAHRERDKQVNRQYRITNRQKIFQRRQKIKLEIIAHYGGKCEWPEGCKVIDPDMLTLDHINGEGSKHRKEIGGGGHRIYRWLIQNKFPSGFRLLCSNHNLKHYFNMIKTREGKS